jgi:hypothetical protein
VEHTYNPGMTPKVRIEHAMLTGAQLNTLQRVATVYIGGQEYRVLAPARAQGRALDWVEHFVVREPSTADFAFGAEVPVDEELVPAVVDAVVEELKRSGLEAEIWNWGNSPDARFYAAQLCLHGHVITADGMNPIREDEHCQECGSRCIHRCEQCRAPIRGKRTMHGGEDYQVPSFCYNCANPYPWMKDRLDTARDLLWHDDNLSLEERESLWDLLQYVMTDPKSDLAPAKRKLIDIKLKPAVAATREFILDFLARFAAQMAQPS